MKIFKTSFTIAEGRIQGMGFRESVEKIAKAENKKGTIKNRKKEEDCEIQAVISRKRIIMTKSSSLLLRLEKGELVNYNGQEYVILKIVDLTKVLAKNMEGNNIEVLEIQHLTPWTVKKDDKTEKPLGELTDISDEDWQFARERLKIIRPLLSRQNGEQVPRRKLR